MYHGYRGYPGWGVEDDVQHQLIALEHHLRRQGHARRPRRSPPPLHHYGLVPGAELPFALPLPHPYSPTAAASSDSDYDGMSDDPQTGSTETRTPERHCLISSHSHHPRTVGAGKAMGRRSRRSSQSSRRTPSPSRARGASDQQDAVLGLGSLAPSARLRRGRQGRWHLTDVYKRLDDLAASSPGLVDSDWAPDENESPAATPAECGRGPEGCEECQSHQRLRRSVERLPDLHPQRSDAVLAALDHRSPLASPSTSAAFLVSATPPPVYRACSSVLSAVAPGAEERRGRSYIFTQDTDPVGTSASASSFLPDLLRTELRPAGLSRRASPRDLHADLGQGLGRLDDALGVTRRASRERLVRRQLLGHRVDRNRSLQEIANREGASGRPSSTFGAGPGGPGGVASAASAIPSSGAAATPHRLPMITPTPVQTGSARGEDPDPGDHNAGDKSGAGTRQDLRDSRGNGAAAADAHAGKTVEDDDDDVQEAVLAVLECPVCRDFLQPPLKQCCNGHVVCFACWPRLSLSVCPACRAPFIPTASLALDGVLRALRFPCPHREHGCGLRLRMDDRAAHDPVCPFRPRGCPLTRCDWQGQADALAAHCRAAHAPIPVRDAPVDVPFLVDRGAAALDGVPTIVYHEQRLFHLSTDGGASSGPSPIFLFQSRYDLWRSKFFAEMVHVASQLHPDDKYAWELELRSSDGSVQLRMRSPVAAETTPAPGRGPRDPAAAATAAGAVHSLGSPSLPHPRPGSPPFVTPSSPTSALARATAATASAALKLDLDVFNQFMDSGKYSLRIAMHTLAKDGCED